MLVADLGRPSVLGHGLYVEGQIHVVGRGVRYLHAAIDAVPRDVRRNLPCQRDALDHFNQQFPLHRLLGIVAVPDRDHKLKFACPLGFAVQDPVLFKSDPWGQRATFQRQCRTGT